MGEAVRRGLNIVTWVKKLLDLARNGAAEEKKPPSGFFPNPFLRLFI